MEPAALQGIATRRSQTWWLLSRLFIEQPTRSLLDDLASALRDAVPDPDAVLAGELARLCAAVDGAPTTDDGVTALQVEFTRLLRGLDQHGGGPPPFESVAREGRVAGDATLAVATFYRDAGFESIAPEAGPPDHLGTELRFLALACYREMEAWARGDVAEARAWLDRERRFLDDHLLGWAPVYCAAMATRATHDIYRAVAALTAAACTSDRDDVDALLAATG